MTFANVRHGDLYMFFIRTSDLEMLTIEMDELCNGGLESLPEIAVELLNYTYVGSVEHLTKIHVYTSPPYHPQVQVL